MVPFTSFRVTVNSSRYRDGVTPNSRLKCRQKWL